MEQEQQSLELLQKIIDDQHEEIARLNAEIKRLYSLLIGEDVMMNSIKSTSEDN